MSLVIIDYGSGNLRSVAKAFARVGADVRVTASANEVATASHIVLPGVGAFADCMEGLGSLPGMLESLNEAVIGQKRWFLGICVGMQMLFEKGHEHGEHKGLGWLKGEVVALGARDEGRGASESLSALKIPHMGWNELNIASDAPLLKGIKTGDHAYFVHSYHALCKDAPNVWASADYGGPVAAVAGMGHIMGTQFHPEKSQATGLRLLENFVNL